MTPVNPNLQKISFFLAATFFISGCSFTVTRSKPPAFRISTDSMAIKVDSLVTCEHISVDGSEKTTGGKTSSEVEIEIINGKNIPTGDTSLRALGKSIAFRIKQELKDSVEYNTFKVLFVTLQTSGNTTTRNYKGWLYKSVELVN